MNGVSVYHLRTAETFNGNQKVGGIPYGTVAVEFNSDGTVNRGIAMCSLKDSFVKSVGVKKALGRLVSAKKSAANVMPMQSFSRMQKKILKHLRGEAKFKQTNFDYFCFYHAQPTEDEKQLFAKERGC